MSELEERLNTLLKNPQLMQQIASMAQAMNLETQNIPTGSAESPASPSPSLDPNLLQTMLQTFSQVNIDSNQKTLLHALSPYLSSNRVQKLERAMQAARLAGAASAFLNAGGLKLLSGR